MPSTVRWDCHEIGADGERRRSCIVYPRFLLDTDDDAAREAASTFDEQEAGERGVDVCEYADTSRLIEVVATVARLVRLTEQQSQAPPVRFRVWCRVRREYEARRE